MMEWMNNLPDWVLITAKIWAVLNVIGIAGIIGFHIREDWVDEKGAMRKV